MADNNPWKVLCRLFPLLPKANDRPPAQFRLFSRSFPALLKDKKSPEEIVFSLLSECMRHKASDINIEPTDTGKLEIYFRVDGLLHKGAIIEAPETSMLRTALHNQSHSPHLGKHGVTEKTISITDQDRKSMFSICDIPQVAEKCILIRPCPTINIGTTGSVTKLPTRTTRNINKKIFIWQMGKVGSLSVYSSLVPFSQPTSWQPPSIKNDTYWPQHNNIIQTHSVKLLYDFLHYSNEEFVIISLVRDLMARNISTIFQSMNFKEKWRNQFYIASAANFKRMPYEQQEREITQHLYTLNTSKVATEWYDNLLMSHFYYPDVDQYLINIYAKPFDQEKGFQIYESNTPRVQMMILRLEDLNAREKELGDFLGIENFQLVLGNTPEGKWYESTYKRFKGRYKPTAKELEAIYNSRFMRYFYSDDQITALTKKWQR